MKSQENHYVRLEEFLAWVKECEEQYRTASEAVALEGPASRKDLLHEMEFAATSKERSRVATKLSRSRKLRREQKDIMKRNEQVVEFLPGTASESNLKRMNQLGGPSENGGTVPGREADIQAKSRRRREWKRSIGPQKWENDACPVATGE